MKNCLQEGSNFNGNRSRWFNEKRVSFVLLSVLFTLGFRLAAGAAETDLFSSGHRYHLAVSDCTWDQALQFSKDAGGHLASFESLDEYNQFLSQLNNSLGVSGIRFWIGGRRDIDSREYHWVDGNNNLCGEVLNNPSSWVYPMWMKAEPSFMDGDIVENDMNLFFYDKENRWVMNDVPGDIISILPEYSGKLGYIIEFDEEGSAQTDLQDQNAMAVVLASVPGEFYFTSGVGAWGTSMVLEKDGSFTGSFHDSNMGADNDIYPGGEVLISNFSGRFDNFRKVDDYTYSMHLSELDYETQPGVDWTDGTVHYIAGDAYGIADGDLFCLYLPGHPVNTLPEGYMSWARLYMYGNDDSPTLPFYGIYNVARELGWGS